MGVDQKFYWGDFFTGWRELEEEWFWQFEPFSKLKTTFCEYWTAIKIKINMTCVPKVYEIEKMEQKQWLQLKMLFLLGYNLKIVICWGGLTFGRGEGIKIWWRGKSTRGGFCYVGGNKQIFGWLRVTCVPQCCVWDFMEWQGVA